MSDTRYMQLAISRAEEGVRQGQSPFGSVIVRDGNVIACEHNRVWQDNDPTAHAEIVAIRTASSGAGTIDLGGCTIYTTCEPCPMCFAAIHWSGITRIVYGVKVSDVDALGFSEIKVSNHELNKNWNTNIEIVGDFMRSENLEILRLWKSLGNKPY